MAGLFLSRRNNFGWIGVRMASETMRAAGLALLAVVWLVGACSSGEAEPCPPTPSPRHTTLEAQLKVLATPAGFHDMLAIEEEVPGFAGMSTTLSPNHLDIKVTKPADVDMEELRAAVVSRFPDLASREIFIQSVRFDFGQLNEWYSLVQNALVANPEVFGHLTGMTIDERHNRIGVGVDTEVTARAARAEISRLGLPQGAVEVELAMQTIHLCRN